LKIVLVSRGVQRGRPAGKSPRSHPNVG
jgi:hypothetical protein